MKVHNKTNKKRVVSINPWTTVEFEADEIKEVSEGEARFLLAISKVFEKAKATSKGSSKRKSQNKSNKNGATKVANRRNNTGTGPVSNNAEVDK
jgi:hypothetical protein